MAASNPRLEESASPYLRAHADNPVAWYPWGPEAFEEAARRGVPVLVSIGYATCHWCHVMARESFADADVAAQLDAGFVAVKVDREEHPEVDAAYLQAASAFTPHLGWPLTAFATPTGRVFYAGTYFPPESRGGMPSFRQVLDAVTEAWTERRGEVEQTAAGLAVAIRDAVQASASGPLPDLHAVAAAVRDVVAGEDERYGGFAPADADLATPKFPMVPTLRLLQSRAVAPLVPGAADVAARALAAMRNSPLFDDVDGGFFRYSTHRDWTEPHYERMLTDNAGLIEVALDAGDFDTAERTSRFLIDVFQQPGGGFAGAQDSESWIDGRQNEGGYYARDAAGRIDLAPPAIDAKIVTGWNGMAIGALASAGVRLGDPALIAAARWAADAVLETHVAVDGSLLRASLDEIPSRAVATQEDYGLLAGGLLDLALATGEPRYADTARDLVDLCLVEGAAPGGGDPVLRGQDIAVSIAAMDADHPSGAASLAAASLRLWLLGAGDGYRRAAEEAVVANAGAALAEPRAYGTLLAVAAVLAASPRQLVVVGDIASPLATAARSIPADVLALVTADQALAFAAAGYELFAAKDAGGSAAAAYDCRDFVCRLPLTDAAALTN